MERSLQATTNIDGDSSPSLLLRLPAVMKMTGLGRSTIYRMVAQQRFPCPVRITSRAVAWRRADVDQWSDACPAATH
jgi:prophage regulatory protein